MSTKLRQVALVSSTIDSSPIGGTTPSTGAFTGLTGTITMPSETPQQRAGSNIVGTGSDVALFTFPALAAGRLQAGKGLRITLASVHKVGTASVLYKLKFGATVIDSFSILPFNNTFVDAHSYLIFNNSGV